MSQASSTGTTQQFLDLVEDVILHILGFCGIQMSENNSLSQTTWYRGKPRGVFGRKKPFDAARSDGAAKDGESDGASLEQAGNPKSIHRRKEPAVGHLAV